MGIDYRIPQLEPKGIPPALRHNHWYDEEMTLDDILSLIQGQPWLLEEGFKIASVQGVRYDFFGCVAATHKNISNLYHEIAHMMDFFQTKPERVSFVEYGFEYAQTEVLGELYDEPTTIQGIDRELRAFAIEQMLAAFYDSIL